MSAISSRFAVAIHILSLLEMNKVTVNTSEYIASSVNTNPVVIRKLTGRLSRAGLVSVKPGVPGASLSRPLREITLLDVFRAVDAVAENELFSVHGTPDARCPVGRHIQPVIGPIFCAAQQALERVLAKMTMDEVAGDICQRAREESEGRAQADELR